jgi:hypothetical protein
MLDYDLSHYKLNRKCSALECDYCKEVHLLRNPNSSSKISNKTAKIVFSLFAVLCVSLFILQTPQPASNQALVSNSGTAEV